MFGQNADHAFRWNSRQWMLPTRETYLQIVAAYHLEDWPEYRPFDDLRAERDRMTAGYAEQIREANAARFVHNLDPNHCNVWYTQEAQGGRKRHPCQKPLDITERIIQTHTHPGALVVDSFAGSGTTGAAAIRTGRRYILIERDATHQKQGAAWLDQEKQQMQLTAKTE